MIIAFSPNRKYKMKRSYIQTDRFAERAITLIKCFYLFLAHEIDVQLSSKMGAAIGWEICNK